MNMTPQKIVESLLPPPHRVTLLPDGFGIDQSCVIVCTTPPVPSVSGSHSSVGVPGAFVGERLAELIADEWGLRLPVRHQEADGPCVLYVTRNANAESLDMSALDRTFAGAGGVGGPGGEVGSAGGNMWGGDEEYQLRVDEHGVAIRSRTTRALLWGAMTLRQLVGSRDNRAGGSGAGGSGVGGVFICGVEIQDRPRYALRGFMIDSGRAPNSLAKLKRIIRICSTFKINAFLFRESDDEMNAVRYRTNKLGSSNPHAFSLDELAELSAYAQQYGITLIPEVESLGHAHARHRHYPELISGGRDELYEGIGVHIRKSHWSPCDAKTFEVLDSIYDEMFGALRQPFIHLGLDEVRLPMDMQSRHVAELLPHVFRVAEKHGVSAWPIVWSDGPATPAAYRGRVYRCMWAYGDDGVIGLENEHLAQQGIEALSQPDCPERVLMAGGSSSMHKPYTKLDYESAFANLASWAQWGNERENHAGLFAVQWSGNMTDLWLPDFLAAADYGWTPPQDAPPTEALDRFKNHLARLTDSASPPPDEVDRPAWDAIWLNGDQWDQEILEATS